MPRTLLESSRVVEATPVEGRPGRFLIGLITPGWGSSGYYSPQVLEQAATDRVFPAGTHMYVDHPTETEEWERPERSIRDLAAVLTEDAHWDGHRLVAEARVFSHWRGPLADMAEAQAMGTSIRASAEVTENGEAEGRRGRIIDRLLPGVANSVDYVTHAGRGGSVLAVLESARQITEARSIGQWIESRLHRDFTVMADDMAGDGRLTREERIALSSAIGDALAAFVASVEDNQPQLYQRDLWDDPADTVQTAAEAAVIERAVLAGVAEATAEETREELTRILREAYAADRTWVYVRDFAAETVWFVVEAPDETATYEQAYAMEDGTASLTGDRTEVRARTQYVPVNPAGRSTTEESEEDTMPQIEEARLRELEEAAGRVQTLESERSQADERATAAEARATEAEQQLAERNRTDRAREIIADRAREGGVTFSPLEQRGLLADLPVTEAGALDETAYTTAVDAAVAEAKEARGAGQIRGFGQTTPPIGEGDVSEADIMGDLEGAFGYTVKGA